MIYKKRVSVGQFAKKDVDYKNGDMVTIANEGKQVEGEWGMRDVFLVKLANGEEKNITFQQTTMNGLIDAFGKDSKDWVGKSVKIHLITQNVSGKFIKVTYISHPQAELTETGFVLPSTEVHPDGDIATEDIPF